MLIGRMKISHREFGAIGNGLSYALGVAAARPKQVVLLTVMAAF